MNILDSFPKKWILLLIIFLPFHFYGQNNAAKSVKELKDIAEKFYGTDDRLANGMISQYYSPNADGHPFFLKNEWFNGEVYSNGVRFNNVAIKYNIESDEIYFIDQNSSQAPTTILNKTMIDSVRIDNHLFLNAAKFNNTNQLGFMELLYKGNFTSFIKYRISYSIKQTSTYEYIQYYSPRLSVYILHDTELILLKSKKDFLEAFTPFQKELTKFLHQNKIRINKADHIQLFQFLKYCDELFSKEKGNS